MPILNALSAAVAWLGRQGTRALAVSIFLGLAVPPLAAYVKPYLGETVFVLLLFSYLRTDPAAFRRYLSAPKLTIMAALWVMVAVPLLFGTAYALFGIREMEPALYTIMILQLATTPITSILFNTGDSNHVFYYSSLAPAASLTLTATALEKGGVTTPLEQRPGIEWQEKVQSLGSTPIAPASAPAAASQ